MGRIVSDSITPGNQGARYAGSFKDGKFIRRIEGRQDNTLIVFDTENNELYRETSLRGIGPFAVRTVSTETSSFDGSLVLIVGGFTPDTDNSRVVTIVTDYKISPPTWYTGK